MNYKHIAESYNELHKEEQLKKLNLIKNYLKQHKISTRNKSILDIGSGTGISTRFFSRNAIGLEPEINMIKQGSYNAVEGTAERLPFKDSLFDIVISITAIHNFKNPKKAVMEIKRVLKPRFTLIITILKRAKNYKKLKALIKSSFKTTELDEKNDTIMISTELNERHIIKDGRLILSGCLVINHKNEVLLLYKINHRHYETPGGKVDLDECSNPENPTIEDLARTAEREVYEELGSNIKLERLRYFGKAEFTIPDGRLAVANKFLTKIISGHPRNNEPDIFSRIDYLPLDKLENYPISPDLKLLLPELKKLVKKNMTV